MWKREEKENVASVEEVKLESEAMALLRGDGGTAEAGEVVIDGGAVMAVDEDDVDSARWSLSGDGEGDSESVHDSSYCIAVRLRVCARVCACECVCVPALCVPHERGGGERLRGRADRKRPSRG